MILAIKMELFSQRPQLEFLMQALRIDANSLVMKEYRISGPDYVFQPTFGPFNGNVAYMFIRSEDGSEGPLFDKVELTLSENTYPFVIPWEANEALRRVFLTGKEGSDAFTSISRDSYPKGKGVMIALPWTLTYSHSHFFNLIIKGIKSPAIVSIYTTVSPQQKQEAVFLVGELFPLPESARTMMIPGESLAFDGRRLRITSAFIVTNAENIDEITILIDTGVIYEHFKIKAQESYGSTKIFPIIPTSGIFNHLERYPNFARVVNVTVMVESSSELRVFCVQHNRLTSCGSAVTLNYSS